jgi:hypothetical protein
MRSRSIVRSLALAFGLLLVGAHSAVSCPNCKEAVANQAGSEASDVARGYNYSVMFMVSMPFTLLGTGAFMVVRTSRRGGLPEL